MLFYTEKIRIWLLKCSIIFFLVYITLEIEMFTSSLSHQFKNWSCFYTKQSLTFRFILEKCHFKIWSFFSDQLMDLSVILWNFQEYFVKIIFLPLLLIEIFCPFSYSCHIFKCIFLLFQGQC